MWICCCAGSGRGEGFSFLIRSSKVSQLIFIDVGSRLELGQKALCRAGLVVGSEVWNMKPVLMWNGHLYIKYWKQVSPIVSVVLSEF